MTTSPVMTVTDELLAELEEAASNATPGPWSYDGSYVCTMRQDGETVYVESWNPVADALLSKNVKYISAANPSTITALTAELHRLRAENAELGGLLREAGKTIHKVQAEQPTPLRIARYLDAMRAKIDTAMAAQ